MKHEYKTLALITKEDRDELNKYYSEGWEFVNSVAANVVNHSRYAHVYFTIRKKLDL